ncbi:XopAG/AvrGf1 family type III secretion system effector [Neorhizobium huautlense]|uniref:XopAG/AvrGf1 family type III secretion system effector n=1 Tax=Neorhizobium huautlense TaxID=67774 RepID=UPI00197C129B|nr:XopAG/AvrGf1 family type III secretion system effector [Neorhizobium huautlense]
MHSALLHREGKLGRKGAGEGGAGEGSSLSARAAKYGLFLASAGYAYNEVANNFFLSTTALHDGKMGFTSNERLRIAHAKARKYYDSYHAAGAEPQPSSERPTNRIRTCGNNQFTTMIDYRAATRVHVARLVDGAEARASLLLNLGCMKGHLVKNECVTKYRPPQVPKDTDLTRSQLYDQKNKYALTGVLNEETGAYGYTSRSITHPFVNKGVRHFEDTIRSEKGQTLKRCKETLEALLEKDCGLGEEAQFAAGQAILNFRQIYAAHWGHAEKVIMKTLVEHGFLSPVETEKLDATLMFEDPDKNKLKRNTSVMGPWLHKFDTRLQEIRSGHEPAVVADLNDPQIADMKYLPIAHFKLNEQGNGFEDCSGLGDSFTCANAVACINHARLMSGQQRLSKEEVIVIIACFNAVYDDATSIRHTLHEIARGCFAGAGYTLADADEFYAGVCRKAAEEYYGGRNLSKRIGDGAKPSA